MLAVALILVLALAAFGLVLFVALLVGMRNEPTYDELSTRPPSPLAALTRHMLGVSVRKPADRQFADDPDAPDANAPREPWFAGSPLHAKQLQRRGRVSADGHLDLTRPRLRRRCLGSLPVRRHEAVARAGLHRVRLLPGDEQLRAGDPQRRDQHLQRLQPPWLTVKPTTPGGDQHDR